MADKGWLNELVQLHFHVDPDNKEVPFPGPEKAPFSLEDFMMCF